MSKIFRWLGPGTLTDFIGKPPRAVEHMGRRDDGRGKVIEGDIVRESTVDPAKLDAWVKTGTAEYINLAEKVVDKLGGSKQSDESKKESERLQAIADQAAASARLTILSEIRKTMASPLFTQLEREDAEKGILDIPAEKLTYALEATKRELDRRQKAAGRKTRGSGLADPATPLEGAGPKAADGDAMIADGKADAAKDGGDSSDAGKGEAGK